MSKIFYKTDYGCPNTMHYFLFGKEIAVRRDRCWYFFGGRIVCWHDWTFELSYEVCGYEEGNGELNISLFGLFTKIKMPWKSKRYPYGDCDAPGYGISIHDNALLFYLGGKGNLDGGKRIRRWDLPFFSKIHVRHDIEVRDEEPHLVPYKSTEFDADGNWVPTEKRECVNIREYDYKDYFDGTTVPCKYWVEEREWRPKWLTWTGKFKTVHRYIEVSFSKEVGKGKGSWKGGTVGCSFELNPNETPEDCIRRMERTRKL